MRESLSTLADLLTEPEFRTGVVLGAVALVALAIAPRAPAWLRPWGLALTSAVLIGVRRFEGQRLGLLAGITLMAVGGWLINRDGASRRTVVTGWVAATVGAAIIPWRGQVDEDDWFFLATPLVALGIGTALSKWDERSLRIWVGPLVAITAFAFWTTVPDTELARLLLGVTVPMALGTLPHVAAPLTSAGAFALGGVLAWLPALGGEGRPASIIGAWASVGVLAIVPMATRLWPGRRPSAPALFGLHAVLTLVAARVIGLWTWAVPALIAATALYALGLLGAHWLATRPATGVKVSGAADDALPGTFD